MHIGLIGGIGVAATVVYYQRLTAEVARRGGTLELTMAHGQIDSLIRNNLSDARREQAEIFVPLLQRLADAGADCAALTSLGAHFCFDELVARSPLPLVSAIAPLDDAFVTMGHDCVGLLGTRSVMSSGLFGQLRQTRAVALEDEIEVLGQAYQEMAVEGTCDTARRQLFLDAGRRLVQDHGAGAVVLAGTDLNLAFDGQEPGYPVIDALDIHVALLADLATGAADLSDLADLS